jgi:serine phosphatase RsbU (regulator of sigma subunit)
MAPVPSDASSRIPATAQFSRAPVVLALAAIISLGLVSTVSYMLFHTLAEVLYAVIGLGIFLMAWTLRQFQDDDFAAFLGIALLATSLLHLVHAVDFPGVDMVSTSLDPPTQLWVAATLIQALSFAAAPFVLGRRLPLRPLLVAYLLLDALVLASIYVWPVFPETLTSVGLTTFKIAAEYAACGILVVAIALLTRKRAALQGAAFPLLAAAWTLSIAAELAFTLYVGPHTWPNMLGHILLIASIVFIYFAVVQDSLARPHALRVANLELSEKAERLARRQEQLIREALEQLLSLTPSFHDEKGEPEIAGAVCRAARDVFGADQATLYDVDVAGLVVLGQDPLEQSMRPGLRLPLAGDREALRAIERRQPVFRTLARSEESTARAGVDDSADGDARQGLRARLTAPIGLAPSTTRLLMLGWTRDQAEPDARLLAMVQRFGDHVDVALTQARRRALQTEAEDLHRTFERSLLPTMPVSRPGLDVHFHSRPGEDRLELGGDFIDVLERGDQSLSIIVGDVTGHGPSAAALGATLRAAWQALETAGVAPLAVVDSLRQVLQRERRGPDIFATLCLAWIDPAGDHVSLLNLGHPPPLLISSDVRRLAAPSQPPLGAFDLPMEAAVRLRLPESWNLFFYTDGLIEGRLRSGSAERFGEMRLVHALERLPHGPLEEAALASLISDVEATGAEPFGDDVTVVVVTRTSTGAKTSPSPGPQRLGAAPR